MHARARTRAPKEQAMRVEEVLNQSPPYVDIDLYASDRPLADAVAANGGGRDAAALSAFGKHWGSAEIFELARAANENPPQLSFRPQGLSPRRHRVSSRLPPFHGGEHRRRLGRLDLARGRAPPLRARAGCSRRALLHGGANRDRTPVPDHHDTRRGGGAGGRSRRSSDTHAEDHVARSTIRVSSRGGKR